MLTRSHTVGLQVWASLKTLSLYLTEAEQIHLKKQRNNNGHDPVLDCLTLNENIGD
jgi:hypothetical protein